MRTLLLEELARSEKIVRDGVEVVPRFRIVTPEGEFVVMIQMKDDLADRQERLDLMAAFMAWKYASGFIFSVETWLGPSGALQDAGKRQGEAILSFGVSRDERCGAMRTLQRNPLRFSAPTWLGPEHIEPGLLAMLPARETTIDPPTLKLLRKAFGPSGWLDAVKLSG